MIDEKYVEKKKKVFQTYFSGAEEQRQTIEESHV